MDWEKFGTPVPWQKVEAIRTSHFDVVREPLLRLQAWRVRSRANAHKDLACKGRIMLS